MDDIDRGARGLGSTSVQFQLHSIHVSRVVKKKEILSLEPEGQPWQVQGSINVVVYAGPESSYENQVARRSIDGDITYFLNGDFGGTTEEVDISMELDESSRALRRVLELANRIGKRPMNILVDSRSTGNYISA